MEAAWAEVSSEKKKAVKTEKAAAKQEAVENQDAAEKEATTEKEKATEKEESDLKPREIRARSPAAFNDQRTSSSTRHASHLSMYTAQYSEADAIFGAEGNFLQHYKDCTKNPGHGDFIPVKDFNINHLPIEYRDPDVFDCVQNIAILTCRLSVKSISKDRPKTFPGSSTPYPFVINAHQTTTISGTGCIHQVFETVSGDPCPCHACEKSENPSRQYVKLTIKTAAHVVYDQYEAENTTCCFFFDQGLLLQACRGKLLLQVDKIEWKETMEDTSYLTAYVHDIGKGEYFKSIYRQLTCKIDEVKKKFRDTISPDFSKHKSSKIYSIFRFNKIRDRLYDVWMKSLGSEQGVNDASDLTIVSLSKIRKLESIIKDFWIFDDRDKSILQKIKIDFGTTSNGLLENETDTDSVKEQLASIKRKLNSLWVQVEKDILISWLVVRREIGDFFLKYKEENAISKIIWKKMKTLINFTRELLNSMSNDLAVFADYITEDMLLIREIVNCRKISKTLRRKIDQLDFSLVETRVILQGKHHRLSDDKDYSFFLFNSWIKELQKQLIVIEVCFSDSCVIYQSQHQGNAIQSSSSPSVAEIQFLNKMIMEAIFNIRTIFLNTMLTVREDISICIRELIKIRDTHKSKIDEQSVGAGATEIDEENEDESERNTNLSDGETAGSKSENIQPLVVIVSHPHGVSKHVSVGLLKHEVDMDVVSDYREETREGEPYIWSYSTATCAGSSGACVMALGCQNYALLYSFQPNPSTTSDILYTHSGCCGHLNHSNWISRS